MQDIVERAISLTEAAQALELVLEVANEVLHTCSILSIDTLKKENPSINEIARGLKVVLGLLEDLFDDNDPHMCHEKAKDYTRHISLIGQAIESDDEEELNRQIQALRERSFLF